MKKTVCIAIIVVCLGAAGMYASAAMQFRGTVINVSDDLIEVKKGSREMTLYWTDQSKVLYKGKEAGRSAVEICQKVRANYTVKDHRHNLVSIEILQESYCTK